MKKFFAAISAATMLLGAVAGLTACGDGAHEHIWDDGEITAAATCTANGVKTYKCVVEGCSESYTENIDKVAHIFTGDWVKVNEEGHARQCANCEAVDSENAVTHSFEEDIEKRVEATCHSDGKKFYECSDCKAEKTEDITERPDHDFANGEWVKVDGEVHAKKCANCEAVDSDNAVTHSFKEDIEKRVPATCHSDGVKTLVCEDCGAQKTEDITERPNHDFENGEWVKDDGEVHAKKCANCEAVDSENAVSHNWDEGTVTVPPAFAQDGEKTYTCTDCDATKTEEIDALTSASFAEEFTTESQSGAWQYGYVDYSWADESFEFHKIETLNEGSDGWQKDGAEIKGGWINAGSMTTVSYTVTTEVAVSVNVSFEGGTENTRLALRIGVKNSEGIMYGKPSFDADENSNLLNINKTFTLNAGDTVYFIFSNEGKVDGAHPNGSLNITLMVQ